jgi:hypothetical protein
MFLSPHLKTERDPVSEMPCFLVISNPSDCVTYHRQNPLESRTLEVFENRVLRRICGSKRDDVKEGWRKLHNKELNICALRQV